MQAAPLSVLRSVATSGHQGKLAIAFTHFDAVKGDNLPGFRAKRDHVVGSVKSSLSSLRNAIGDVVSGPGESDRSALLHARLARPADDENPRWSSEAIGGSPRLLRSCYCPANACQSKPPLRSCRPFIRSAVRCGRFPFTVGRAPRVPAPGRRQSRALGSDKGIDTQSRASHGQL